MEENTTGLEEKLKVRDIAGNLGRFITTSVKKDFREHPIRATLKNLSIGAIFAIMYCSVQSEKLERRVDAYNRHLTQEVSVLADTDQDSATTSQEWASVYKELDVRYDAFSSNPQDDFTIGQKENYIKSHK